MSFMAQELFRTVQVLNARYESCANAFKASAHTLKSSQAAAKTWAHAHNLCDCRKEKSMPRKYSVDAVLAGIEKIDRVWTDNPTFTLGDITHQSVQEKIAALRQMTW